MKKVFDLTVDDTPQDEDYAEVLHELIGAASSCCSSFNHQLIKVTTTYCATSSQTEIVVHFQCRRSASAGPLRKALGDAFAQILREGGLRHYCIFYSRDDG